jgi:predicted  nucleic acid-binding Zn-ribbon protein
LNALEKLTKLKEKERAINERRAVVADKISDLHKRREALAAQLQEAGIDITDPANALKHLHTIIDEALRIAERQLDDTEIKLAELEKNLKSIVP